MIIEEVHDSKGAREFLDVAKQLYKNDDAWVCPLDRDINAVFDPERNTFHSHGAITRWVLKSDGGKLIGRIAAFIDEHKAYLNDQPTGGVGFFECIDDRDAASLLFDTAKAWLSARGMEAMDGPVNFGENDSFWGLLVEGFTTPSYGMNYNHRYYQQLFEDYGFKTLYEQITNRLDVHQPFPERFTKIASWVANKQGYTFRHFEAGRLKQYAADFVEIYNDAWKDFEHFVPLDMQTVLETFNKMKTVMDERLIWFAYVHGEPSSVIVMLPDANQMIKGFNGRLGIVEKLRFLYKRWKGVSRMRAVVMGTKQAYQNHGLESALFIKLKEYVLPLNQYRELELSWVGDFNEKMLALHKATGAVFAKRHATMRKIFE